jgi:hypothetical protein
MKKSVLKRGIIIALLLFVIFTISSCGNSIVGSWTNTSFGLATTLRFDGNGTLNVSALGIEVVAGTYIVSGNQLILSSSENLLGTGLSSGTSNFSISGDQLTIGGVVFIKDK